LLGTLLAGARRFTANWFALANHPVTACPNFIRLGGMVDGGSA
jgi:hypothetical protein